MFFDLVAFSKGATTKQMVEKADEISNTLDRRLRPDYYWDERDKENDLILTPTGDGYAITLCSDFEHGEILKIVSGIYYDLVRRKKLKARFGINVGPNVAYVDLNESMNIAGWGITKARRVMDEAGPNQILCDSSFAEPVKQDIRELKDIGIKKTKWGLRMRLYNYKKGNTGVDV